LDRRLDIVTNNFAFSPQNRQSPRKPQLTVEDVFADQPNNVVPPPKVADREKISENHDLVELTRESSRNQED